MILTFHHEVLDNFENVFLKKSISAWPEESHRRCSMKNCVVESFAKFTGKRLCQSLLFNKLQTSDLYLLIKETLAQVFSFEFCKIFKTTFFVEHLLMTASGYL